jgi:hypothetical protein
VEVRERPEAVSGLLDLRGGVGKMKHRFFHVFLKLDYVEEFINRGQMLPMLSLAKGGHQRRVVMLARAPSSLTRRSLISVWETSSASSQVA